MGPTRLALNAYYPHGDLGPTLALLPDHHIAYIRNPKAACTTILVWLHRVHTGDHEFDVQDVHTNRLLPHPKEVGWPRIAAMLDGDAYRFTFVRHPAQRAESAYRDKIARAPRALWRRQVWPVLGLPEGAPISFEAFVDALEKQDPLLHDVHWRPQHLNLMHGLVEYDFIGKVETFDADFEVVREKLGLTDVPVTPKNMWDSVGPSLFDERPDLLARVEAVYARDYELYGYRLVGAA